MKERERIDITGYSYEEFVSFIFDREIRADAGKYRPWYFDIELTFDPNRLCEFYIRLFRTEDFAHAIYSKAQLESGFWAIHWRRVRRLRAAFDLECRRTVPSAL